MSDTPPVKESQKLKARAKASLALLLVAVISITTATYAWFSLSNNVMVQNMEISVGTGVILRARAGSTGNNNLNSYYATIFSPKTMGKDTGEVITDGLQTEANKDFDKIRLWPVSSGTGREFYTYANLGVGGTASPTSSLYYAELTFYFFSETPMDVYLNGEDSFEVAAGESDKTAVTPVNTALDKDKNAVKALRISFTDSDGTTKIYEPERATGENTTLSGNAGSGTQNTFSNLGVNAGRNKGATDETPALFHLDGTNEEKVIVRIWIEGADKDCVNSGSVNIEQGKVNVRLRFCGADDDGNYIEVHPT